MDAVRQLVLNLVGIVVLAVFLEMILTSGEMRRYVVMVMGFLIIVAVLQACNDFMRGKWGGHLPVINPTSGDNMPAISEIISEGERINRKNSSQALDDYRRGLEKQISALAGLKTGQKVTSVRVELYNRPEEEKYGGIKEVYITLEKDLTPGIAGENKRHGTIEGTGSRIVKPVEIKGGQDPGSVSANESPETTVPGLAETIANYYNLDLNQVVLVLE